MLTAPDAAAIAAAVAAFDTALTTANNPATRTAVTVAAKDDARTAAEQICRQFAILIKFNAGISDPDKIAIGVRPVNPNREPINAPATSPLLNIIAATPGKQTLRYADSLTPDSPAKPAGASELLLFRAIAPLPRRSPIRPRPPSTASSPATRWALTLPAGTTASRPHISPAGPARAARWGRGARRSAWR
jgi:hypothetical protein